MSHRKQKYANALFTLLEISLSSILIVSSGGASFILAVIGQLEGQQNTVNSTNIGHGSGILVDPMQIRL